MKLAVTNVKGLIELLASIGMQRFGESKVLKILNTARESGQIDRFQYRRLKLKIEKLSKIAELNNKAK